MHYGNEEVVLLDMELDIKGYSGTTYTGLVMCLGVNVCSFRTVIDG